MLDFEKQMSGDVLIEKINLPKATLREASVIKKRLFEDIQLKNKKIIVYIGKCTFIDSSFIGAMVVSMKKIRETGGDIKIVISSSLFTAGVLNYSGLLRVFDTYTSIKDAVKSFRYCSKRPHIEFLNHREIVFI